MEKQTVKTGTAIKKRIEVPFMILENTPQSILAVYRFINGKDSVKLNCNAAIDSWDRYSNLVSEQGFLQLTTLESGNGVQNIDFGDYVMRGVKGEFYPCKPDIFELTYDVV